MDGDSKISEKKPGDSMATLQQRYPIRYHYPSRVPVQLIISGNKLRILFFVRYAKSMFESFPGTNLTYADIAESGIRKNWSGLYYFPWLADDGYERAHAKASIRILDNNEDPLESDIDPLKPSVRTTVEFIRYGSQTAITNYPKQRFYYVCLSNGRIIPAHVISPPWRWYWGFFRTFQIESLHLNWSLEHPGKVTLQRESDRYAYKQICAHEIGHILGLGDAYGANYRFFFEAPGTSGFMMCHNRKVQSEEMEMVFKSHMINRMHYFPRKLDRKTFSTGLTRAYRLQFHALAKNSRKRN